jgi:formate--tetrahydrofolate ligase
MDLCDRQLRHCDTGLGSRFDGMPRRSGFDITAASEVMAILALAEDMKDLERRLRRIHLAYRKDGSPVYAEELGCVPALCVLLKDALQPNLVQNLEGGPVIVHCGPFANIAHGCNSVRATKLGMGLADYVVTEAGFAADLGAEKFLHIKCRQAGLQPELAVLVLSCRALKLHGGVPFEEVNQENRTAIQAGWENARVHIENLARMGLRTLVAINRFPQDTDYELDAVFELCQEADVPCRLSEVAALGGKGGESLAEAVLEMTEQKAPDPSFVYSLDASITQKIEALASTIYRADGVDYTSEAEASIKYLEEIGCGGLPLCTAKTQLSISDKSDRLGAPTNYRLQVRDVSLSHGAGFLVLKTGKILLMPGMGQEPAAQSIGLDS